MTTEVRRYAIVFTFQRDEASTGPGVSPTRRQCIFIQGADEPRAPGPD